MEVIVLPSGVQLLAQDFFLGSRLLALFSAFGLRHLQSLFGLPSTSPFFLFLLQLHTGNTHILHTCTGAVPYEITVLEPQSTTTETRIYHTHTHTDRHDY